MFARDACTANRLVAAHRFSVAVAVEGVVAFLTASRIIFVTSSTFVAGRAGEVGLLAVALAVRDQAADVDRVVVTISQVADSAARRIAIVVLHTAIAAKRRRVARNRSIDLSLIHI